MKLIIIFTILSYFVNAFPCDQCPHTLVFSENGWIIHDEKDFNQILEQKLRDFIPEIGADLILEYAEYYKSDFSHDYYLIMSILIFDRISTPRDEMWGDVSLAKTDYNSDEYVELRWYDPATKKKHIVCNSKYVCCLSTKVPLAYNTIF